MTSFGAGIGEDYLLRIEFFCFRFIREIVTMKQVSPLRKKRRRTPTDSGVPSEGVRERRGPEEDDWVLIEFHSFSLGPL